MALVSKIVDTLNRLRLLPLYALMKVHPKHRFFDEERQNWYASVLGKQNVPQNFRDNIYLLTLPEYRSVLYWRMGGLRYFISWWAPGERVLHLVQPKDSVGPGLVIHHGHSSRVACKQIGCNCQIWHNVTTGIDRPLVGGRPIIGDNVRICAGAIVLGGIKVGDNSTIAAGSVVLKNVPANAVVAGNPALLVKLNGQKVVPPVPLT